MTNVPYRIRVELPNRPGALANVASIIANHGGNVVSVDIHEVEGQQAVDEIIVMLPPDWTPAALASDLSHHDAGTLLSSTSAALAPDSIVRALRWATSLVRSGAMDGGLELARALAELCTSSVAWIATIDEAMQHEVGRLAMERGAPFVQLSTPPTAMSAGLPESSWILAVPDDAIQPTRVAFVGRASSFRFTNSEIVRVEALLHLVREMASVAL
jgi:ACT domain